VTSAVIRQKPFIVVNPSSKSSADVKHIVGRIEKTDTVRSSGVAGFLKKFLEK
jgi:flagellar biosynthesis protein FlhG